ncbi:uncharacterized protein LOC112602143 isoform X5 [Melanaphis sacchari]|uniref:uncharacterized protein LOC112602143 isoform X5 n=1 Tax=Melanaphis sacchari TaxID=742174 RepID=UPI000DC152D9|nr:uncharacterized protein LOC112602143 isoform X5 [Melanaphis sacchari]
MLKTLTILIFTHTILQCDAFYVDAAPSVTREDLTAETADDRKAKAIAGQLETPLIDGNDSTHSTSTTEHEMLAKGPLSGIVPGGGETTSTAPATDNGGSTLPFGGLPTGIPGAGTLYPSSQQGDGSGQSPTLILGGFSAIVMPLRGMNMANLASMLSGGQQLSQMLPKPGGS